MGFSYFTPHATSPELDRHLRRANEERAAAVHAAFQGAKRAVSAMVGKLAESVGRARRAGRTSRALNALSDSQLRDIGLHRAEITDVAEAVATEGSGSGVTLADLHRIRAFDSAETERPAVSLPAEDRRARLATRPATAPAAKRQRAAA